MATKATPAKLSDNARSLTDAGKNGQAFGALLGESAAQILLREYGERQQPTTPATEKWYRAWDALQSALNTRADEPAVAAALKALDDAFGNALMDSEDRTWHAAWTTVIGLMAGNRCG